ncbi:MAG: hypothetical protein NZ602_05060 [Thermoguttaceae bacterium]|nr:hypothetical protein [Thermoguttaceae bacterium]MDW8039214.1 hypothetical protein [Thermoguttaceae bacterium]
MIAPRPVPEPCTPEKQQLVYKARRIVAAMFFGSSQRPPPEVGTLALWKAWVFVGWVLSVAAMYVWTMLGTW